VEDLGSKAKKDSSEICMKTFIASREKSLNLEILYAIQNLIYNNSKQVSTLLSDGHLKALFYNLLFISQTKKTLKHCVLQSTASLSFYSNQKFSSWQLASICSAYLYQIAGSFFPGYKTKTG